MQGVGQVGVDEMLIGEVDAVVLNRLRRTSGGLDGYVSSESMDLEWRWHREWHVQSVCDSVLGALGDGSVSSLL